jgi:uroporphyrinogen-III synthase
VAVSWLITREAEDARADCAALAERGVEAWPVPCVEFQALPWPRWTPGPGTPLTVLSSKQAAQRYLEQPDRQGLKAGMAPVTADLLARHGVSCTVVARGGAVALAEAVRAAWTLGGQPSWHVRWPTSDLGALTAEQGEALEVLKRVGPVQRAAVYRTRAPVGLADELHGLLKGPWSATFSSPSAVQAFVEAAPRDARAPLHVICLGRSTLRAWEAGRRPGWVEALLTSSLLDTVVSLEEAP